MKQYCLRAGLLSCYVTSVVSDSVRPHERQPTRLPWVSPGKNTRVCCHFLLQCMKVKSQSEVTQSCPTLCNPMDCSWPGSSVRGILQARILEWVAMPSSRESSQPGDQTQVSCTAGRLYHLSHQGSPRLFTLPITSFCEKVFILTQSKFKRIDSIVYHIGSPSSCVLDWNKFMNILYYP